MLEKDDIKNDAEETDNDGSEEPKNTNSETKSS